MKENLFGFYWGRIELLYYVEDFFVNVVMISIELLEWTKKYIVEFGRFFHFSTRNCIFNFRRFHNNPDSSQNVNKTSFEITDIMFKDSFLTIYS